MIDTLLGQTYIANTPERIQRVIYLESKEDVDEFERSDSGTAQVNKQYLQKMVTNPLNQHKIPERSQLKVELFKEPQFLEVERKVENLGDTSRVKSPSKIPSKNVGQIEENTIRVSSKIQTNLQAETPGNGTIDENTVVDLKLNDQQNSVTREQAPNLTLEETTVNMRG